MKAVIVTQHGGPEVMRYTDMNRPAPAANQVLIRVEATGVNYADIKGRYGNPRNIRQLPYIPGLDVAGTIVETGADITEFRVGQRVIAFTSNGSYAEYVATDAILTFPLPDAVDFKLGAACPIVAFTSHQLLADVARIREGETVLIHGAAGGVGSTAVQIAKLLGASQVIGTVSSESKAAIAKEAGADHVIHHTEEDFSKAVLDITDGKGADVILDSISGPVTERSLSCLAMYGRLVVFGNMGGPTKINTADLFHNCRSVLGFSFGHTRKHRPHLVKPTAEKVLGYLSKGSLHIVVGDTFSLAEAADAHRLVEARNSIGKILLVPEHR